MVVAVFNQNPTRDVPMETALARRAASAAAENAPRQEPGARTTAPPMPSSAWARFWDALRDGLAMPAA